MHRLHVVTQQKKLDRMVVLSLPRFEEPGYYHRGYLPCIPHMEYMVQSVLVIILALPESYFRVSALLKGNHAILQPHGSHQSRQDTNTHILSHGAR